MEIAAFVLSIVLPAGELILGILEYFKMKESIINDFSVKLETEINQISWKLNHYRITNNYNIYIHKGSEDDAEELIKDFKRNFDSYREDEKINENS